MQIILSTQSLASVSLLAFSERNDNALLIVACFLMFIFIRYYLKFCSIKILVTFQGDSGSESSPIRLKDFKGQNHKGGAPERDNLVTWRDELVK